MSFTVTMAAGIGAALIFAVGLVFRKRLTAMWSLLGTVAQVVCTLTALLAWAYARVPEDAENVGDRGLRLRLGVFDEYLASESHVKDRTEKFSVCVLGDSTHQTSGRRPAIMTRVFSRIAADRGLDDMELYGFAAPGFDAFDFYFLLNRILQEKPDLIVLPLNLRSFGDIWIRPEMFYRPVLERYSAWSEYPRAAALSCDARKIEWEHLLLQKLDYEWMGYRGHPFLGRLKNRYGEIEAENAARIEEALFPFMEPLPEKYTLSPIKALRENQFDWRLGVYNPDIERDHDWFPVFRAINQLAERHGIEVLYYTVQTPEIRALPEKNFGLLEEFLTEDPNVYFLTMLDVLQPNHFTQGEHFTIQGMGLVASRILDEVERIEAESRGAPGRR